MTFGEAKKEIQEWRTAHDFNAKMTDDKIASHVDAIIVLIYDKALAILNEVKEL